MMATKNVLTLLLFLIVGCLATEIPIKYTKYVNCSFTGYKPGGGPKRAGDINSTIAELAAKQVTSVIGTDKKASPQYADDFFSALESSAPKLGPTLGKFGAVAGIVMSRVKPKHQDILDAANSAMGKLARDVNEKIDSVKGYVDQSVTKDLKKLVNRDFQGSFDLWVGCIDEANIQEANECQRDAYGDAKSLKSDFAVYSSELLAAKHLNGAQVRELEVYLLPVRNYVNLQIMILKPLIEVYENDTSNDGMYYHRKYRRHLRELVDYYTAYNNLAIQEIVNYWEGNTPNERPCSSEVDLTCKDARKDVEGLTGSKNPASHYVCSCKIDDVQQMCDLHLQIPTESNYNKSEYKVFVGEEEEIVKNYGSKLLRRLRSAFEKEAGPVIKEYWDAEVLSFKKVWKQARDFATGSENQKDDEKLEEGAEMDEILNAFSSHYAQRKAKAEFVTTSNTYFKEHDNTDHS